MQDKQAARSITKSNLDLPNRKAAAWAWYKHEHKGGWTPLTSRLHLVPQEAPIQASKAKGLSSAQSPTIPREAIPPCNELSVENPSKDQIQNREKEHVHLIHPHKRHSQASRFRTEAMQRRMQLQKDASNNGMSMIRSPEHHNPADCNILNVGQSLALLSLLPGQLQSQSYFMKKLRKKRDSIVMDAAFASPWDCGSSLYDSFELLSLSNQLGYCLTTVHPSTSTTHINVINNMKFPPPPAASPSFIPRSIIPSLSKIVPSLGSMSSKSSYPKLKRSSLIHPYSTPVLNTTCTSHTQLPSLHSHSCSTSSATNDAKPGPFNVQDVSHFTKVQHESKGSYLRTAFQFLKNLVKETPQARRTNISELPSNLLYTSQDEDETQEHCRHKLSQQHNRAHHAGLENNFKQEGFRTLASTKSSKAKMWTRPNMNKRHHHPINENGNS